LFAVMTPHRYEIEFQGSNDGQTWTPYVFPYKPQALDERPHIYAPYQPRFDWNLWFASLTSWNDAPIAPLTQERLLENDADVLGLFSANRGNLRAWCEPSCGNTGSVHRKKNASRAHGGGASFWERTHRRCGVSRTEHIAFDSLVRGVQPWFQATA